MTPTVQLLTHTAYPVRAVAMAARLCYSPRSISDLDRLLTPADEERMVAKILELGHTSCLEHAVFSFGIEGISRACSHQLVRHRVASYSQQSQRYVPACQDFARVIPPTVADNPEALAVFNRCMDECANAYHDLLRLHIPAEDARFALPNAAETKLVVTMNARELVEVFFAERLCNRAQWEIRALAREMWALVAAVAPPLFKTVGPGCCHGACPEGRMTCGKPWARQA